MVLRDSEMLEDLDLMKKERARKSQKEPKSEGKLPKGKKKPQQKEMVYKNGKIIISHNSNITEEDFE